MSLDASYMRDAMGRVEQMQLPGARVVSFSYDPTSGTLAAVTTSAGQDVDFSYDGPLQTAEIWSGPISGSITTAQVLDGYGELDQDSG